jgi:hypothetical protein
MRPIVQWFKRRFTSFDLLPEYFTAAAKEMQNVLWGALLPFVGWGIWFIVSTPPAWVNWMAVLLAVLLGGYYTWRADHIRLLPRFEVKRFHVQHTPANLGRFVIVQLELACTTEAVVEECQGWLLAIKHKYPEGSGVESVKWEETAINEPLVLQWSISDSYDPVSLHPGVLKRLNVFSFYGDLPHPFVPQIRAEGVPLRFLDVLTRQGSFRFEVLIRAKDCAPRHASLEYTPGEEWDKPNVCLA